MRQTVCDACKEIIPKEPHPIDVHPDDSRQIFLNGKYGDSAHGAKWDVCPKCFSGGVIVSEKGIERYNKVQGEQVT